MNIGTELYDTACNQFGKIQEIDNDGDVFISWGYDEKPEYITETFFKRLIDIKYFILFDTPQEKLAIQIKYGK
jgi:hypothetical protein